MDITSALKRLEKQMSQLEKELKSASQRLNNPNYLAKAPTEVIEALKQQATVWQKRLSSHTMQHEQLSQIK